MPKILCIQESPTIVILPQKAGIFKNNSWGREEPSIPQQITIIVEHPD